MIFSTSDHLPTLLKLADKTPQVKLLVSMDDLTDEAKKVLVEWGEIYGIRIMELSERASHGSSLNLGYNHAFFSRSVRQDEPNRTDPRCTRHGGIHMLHFCTFQD